MTSDRKRDALGAAHAILKTLRSAGFEAWLAGGCVRDHLLGWEPSDYDVATSASPDEVESLFPRTIPIGKAFGVINVLKRGCSVEVATFRAEGSYKDGRHPDGVRFTDAREDVLRRDFSVNGLLWDPGSGEIRDYVGGRADLESGLIRAIGDPLERFQEDGLRILRAVRFSSLGDFHLEEGTEEALLQSRGQLQAVSRERIHDELRKIATHPRSRRGDAWRLFSRCHLDELLFSWSAASSAEEDAQVLDALEGRSLPLFLAAVLRSHPRLGSTIASARRLGLGFAKDLRCSGADRTLLAELLASRPRYRGFHSLRPGRRFLLATRADFRPHEDLLRAEGDPGSALKELREIRNAASGAHRPAPLVDGGDALAAGIEKGRLLGRALRRVRVLQLEGKLSTPEEARRRLSSPSGRSLP